MSAVLTSRISRPALAGGIAEALQNGAVLLVAGAGYGKTMALGEALETGGLRSVWIACAQTGGDQGRVLMALVEGLRNGTLRPVIHQELPLGQAPRAHEAVMENGHHGKIVLVP